MIYYDNSCSFEKVDHISMSFLLRLFKLLTKEDPAHCSYSASQLIHFIDIQFLLDFSQECF